jgi:peroxiredoxin
MTIFTRRNLALAGAALATAALTAGALIASTARAAVENGLAAPAFAVEDSYGKTRTLAEFAGKPVVLEWTNDGCPFTRKHYDSGNMQRLQKEARAQGAAWLTVISSAPGKQGYADAARANDLTKARGAAPTAVLLDPTGALGHLYGAKTTPHMFVIGGAGRVIYQGAIDDRATPSKADIPGAKNYVRLALADMKAGRPVAVASTRPYGCSVKYQE